MMKFIIAIGLLLQEVLAQEYQFGKVLLNDVMWIDSYEGFGTGITNEGQDFTSTSTTTFDFGTHSSPFSFKNIDIVTGKIFIQKLVPNPTSASPAGLLYIVLHDIFVYVFNVNTVNQYELKSTYQMPSSALMTSYNCFDMAYLSNKIYIICNTGTSTNMVIINHNIVDLQTGVNTFTASATKPLTSPKVSLITLTGTSGATNLFVGVWNQLATTDFLTTTQVANTLANSNYVIYLLNTTSGITTEKDIPITNPHKLLSIDTYSKNILVTHYNKIGTTITGKASVCTIPVDPVTTVLTCQDLNTAYSLTAGYSIAVVNSANNGASLHYFEASKNLVATCTLSLSGFVAQSDANCKYSNGAVDTTLKIEYNGFANADSEFATLIYKNTDDNTYAVADFISKETVQAVSQRRRFNDETYYVGGGSYLIVGNAQRAVMVNSSSNADMILFKTTVAAAILDPISMILLKDNSTIAKNFKAQVVAINEVLTLPMLGGIMNGTTGYFAMLPYGRMNIEGNEITATATTTDGDTLVIHDNIVVYNTSDTVTLDSYYLLGDALIGVVLNSSNASYIRYYSCSELLNTTINMTCTYKTQIEINGLAKFLDIRAKAIANGSILASSPVFKIVESIVAISNLKSYIVIHTKDDFAPPNHRVMSVEKGSTAFSVQNFSSTYAEISMTEYRHDLFLAAYPIAGYPVDVIKAPNFNMNGVSQFMRFDKTLVANDLCAKAAQIYVMGYPRLRIISQCATTKEYVIDKEIYPSTTRGYMSFYSNIVENPALATTINGCFLGQYYIYWEASKSKIYGLAGYQTDHMILDLASYIPGAITNWYCFANSKTMAVMGLDSSSKQILLVISVENMQAPHRILFKVSFSSTISNVIVSDTKTQSLYMTYSEGGVIKSRKFTLDGPYIFTNSTNNIQAKVTAKIQNSAKSDQKDSAIQFASVSQTATVTKVKSIPVSANTFNLEELFNIVGPTFNMTSSGFDSTKIAILPRVYANGTMTSAYSHSNIHIEGFMSLRVQYFDTNTSLLVYRDPETLRYNLSTEYYIDGPVAVIQDRIDYTAFILAEGLNLTQKVIFVYRTPLVSSQFNVTKGYIHHEIKSTQLTMRYIKQYAYQVAQFNKDSMDLILEIYDLSKLNANWVLLIPSAKERTSQGKLYITKLTHIRTSDLEYSNAQF